MKTTVLPLSPCYDVVITEDDSDERREKWLEKEARKKALKWVEAADLILSQAVDELICDETMEAVVKCALASVFSAAETLREAVRR